MTFSEEQIEWIVREVLRRLRAAAAPATEQPTAITPTELRIKERVVTLRSIEGQLTGIDRVIVPQKAVVTPAVKDELRSRKIQLATSTSN